MFKKKKIAMINGPYKNKHLEQHINAQNNKT